MTPFGQLSSHSNLAYADLEYLYLTETLQALFSSLVYEAMSKLAPTPTLSIAAVRPVKVTIVRLLYCRKKEKRTRYSWRGRGKIGSLF